MCVRYKNIKTNLSVWATEHSFSTFDDLENATEEHFPGSESGVIALYTEAQRSLLLAYWGLTPHWAKDSRFGKKSAYNARSETIKDLPTFRSAFKDRRCLIPLTSFFERAEGRWLEFSSPSDSAFAVAGLYELPNKMCPSVSYSMVTTEPNEAVIKVHDRMPVILTPDTYDTWLSPTTSQMDLLDLCHACPSEYLTFKDAGPVGKPKSATH